MNKPTNATLERRVTSYLPPATSRLFEAYVADCGESESRSAAYMIRQFFDRMPQEERARLLRSTSKNHY